MSTRAAALLVALAVLSSACGSIQTTFVADTPSTTATEPEPEPEPAEAADGLTKPVVEPPSAAPTELEVTDLIAGDGPEAAIGDYLTMHYVGVRHADAVQFDASWDRGSTFGFALGLGNVIQGWDQGIEGMKVGGRRMLSIPSALAYGDSGAGADIPPGTDLVFVVDLLAVATPPEVENTSGPVTGLQIEVVSEGDGDALAAGAVIDLHYVLMDQATGEVVDSSWTARPIQYQLSADAETALVPGWDEALVGARVGDHLRVIMPPDMLGLQLTEAFGDATLVTEVTVLGLLAPG